MARDKLFYADEEYEEVNSASEDGGWGDDFAGDTDDGGSSDWENPPDVIKDFFDDEYYPDEEYEEVYDGADDWEWCDRGAEEYEDGESEDRVFRFNTNKLGEIVMP